MNAFRMLFKNGFALSLLALVVSVPELSAWGGADLLIQKEDRICKVDQDCELVVLDCRCMYCARPEDKSSGVADAVTKKAAARIRKQLNCDSARAAVCATAGACAETGLSLPVCVNQKCSLEYKPRAGG